MNEEKRAALKKSIDRQIEDNARIVEQNLKNAELRREEIIPDLILRRFTDLINDIKKNNKTVAEE